MLRRSNFHKTVWTNAEVKRLSREVGRGVARTRIEADPGPGDDAPFFIREQLA